MSIKDWMTIEPITVTPETPVPTARSLLRDNGFRHLPVVEDGRLVGMVSDHDVRIDDRSLQQVQALADVPGMIGEATPVRTIMSASVHSLSPDASVGDAARLMLSRRISAVPVVDGQELVGIITTTDCLLAALTDDPDLELSEAADGG